MAINPKAIEDAPQGVRQKGFPKFGKTILNSGEVFTSTRYPNCAKDMKIPEGCVGLVHEDDETISVVRDDCQAVRRFKKQHLPIAIHSPSTGPKDGLKRIKIEKITK